MQETLPAFTEPGLTTSPEREQSYDVRPGGSELASVEGHNPLGHTEGARQVGGQPAQAGAMGEDRAQRQIVLDGAACEPQEEEEGSIFISHSLDTSTLAEEPEWDVREEGTGRECGRRRSEQATKKGRSRLAAGPELLPSTS